VRWTVIASVVIVVFDGVAALAAKALSFEYGGFPGILVSTAIYAMPAVMVALGGQGARSASLAGATVAFADATVGWAVSWLIGPGAPPADSRSPEALALTVLFVVTVGALVGLIAGLVTPLMARKRSAGS